MFIIYVNFFINDGKLVIFLVQDDVICIYNFQQVFREGIEEIFKLLFYNKVVFLIDFINYLNMGIDVRYVIVIVMVNNFN